ncbi:MAG TPA: CvpA family protein, partial [Tepidisphaeraceae bacterium]|nr:CvpA family protein [Tepidisphaeraceae bacterium]
MLFLIIIGLFLVAIVFFHSMQGFFSAALSAIFCVVAAAVAIGYHETVVESLLGGAMADYAHALVLLALFAIVYLVLRVIFDNFIKDNVRVPSAVDKAGAVAMGVVAGVFATGIMAIAASELPFGVSIGGYSRFEVQPDRPVVVPTGRNMDRTEYNELAASTPGKLEDPHGLMLLPVDNIVVGTVDMFSKGSLSSGKPLDTVHPDLLTEAWGQRAGIEAGANHVAMNLPAKKKEAVDLIGLFTHNFPP